jgi:hypothetical protein
MQSNMYNKFDRQPYPQPFDPWQTLQHKCAHAQLPATHQQLSCMFKLNRALSALTAATAAAAAA